MADHSEPNGTTSGLVEALSRCSEVARQYFESAIQDLDRRMGASLARIRERGLVQSSLIGQSASRAGDACKELAASASQE